MTSSRTTRAAMVAAFIFMTVVAGAAWAQHDHDHPSEPTQNFLSDEVRELGTKLIMQDSAGRMKPLDTYVREQSMKVTKRENFEDWQPIDFYLSWQFFPGYWQAQPLLAVRFPGVKDMLGVTHDVKWVSFQSLLEPELNRKIVSAQDEAMQTPDRDRSKLQRKLLKFVERAMIFNGAIQDVEIRLFPLPGDPDNTWISVSDVLNARSAADLHASHPDIEDFYAKASFAANALAHGTLMSDSDEVGGAFETIRELQITYGAAVMPSDAAVKAELWLNSSHAFRNVTMPYLAAFVLLMVAFFWNLFRNQGRPYSWKHPLYLLGMLVFLVSFGYHLFAYILRWVASGRAPLSNGYESLIFIALATALAGLLFELRDRRGSSAGVAALMTMVILAVAMLSTFDPAIGPLVPVLASYWLNIHVTIITGSYGFLGLGSMLGALNLILLLFKGPGRPQIRETIYKLDRLLFRVLVTGLGLLSIGTLLGGVWANESWGRYWGWDPKETWSLVTILVYAIALHFRWIPAMNRPWVLAASGFACIASVVMTYFGVNYFLSGLHSYAQGDAAQVPSWVFIGAAIIIGLSAVSYLVDRYRSWETPS